MALELNQRAARLVSEAVAAADQLRVGVSEQYGATLLDFGVSRSGGLEAGLLLARICMADLADIQVVPPGAAVPLPQVQVITDQPVAACLQSQYAGWKIATDDYFAMGSGPMRALATVEELLQELPAEEDRAVCVGVLESASLPTHSAIEYIRQKTAPVGELALVTAPTASIAGTVQVVARSVETPLHKLPELKFPLSPLPPVAKDDLQGIGRTNDAILYGGTVTLWVECEDSLIEQTGPAVPSSSSDSHGRTFLELFEEAGHDFYQLDPKLFSPAVVVFHNLRTGRTFRYGRCVPELLRSSFQLPDADAPPSA